MTAGECVGRPRLGTPRAWAHRRPRRGAAGRPRSWCKAGCARTGGPSRPGPPPPRARPASVLPRLWRRCAGAPWRRGRSAPGTPRCSGPLREEAGRGRRFPLSPKPAGRGTVGAPQRRPCPRLWPGTVPGQRPGAGVCRFRYSGPRGPPAQGRPLPMYSRWHFSALFTSSSLWRSTKTYPEGTGCERGDAGQDGASLSPSRRNRSWAQPDLRPPPPDSPSSPASPVLFPCAFLTMRMAAGFSGARNSITFFYRGKRPHSCEDRGWGNPRGCTPLPDPQMFLLQHEHRRPQR